jgi:hypothetical protein
MRRQTAVLAPFLLSMVLMPALAEEDGTTEVKRKYRSGVVRVAAFVVPTIDTTIVARSENVPLGIYIDLSKDLGLADSATVPRVAFSYRFSRRHQLDFDWFPLDRSTTHELGRTIEFLGREFEIGARIDVDAEIAVYKLLYTWLFHDQGKITLGGSVGLNVLDFDLGLRVDPLNAPEVPVEEKAGLTAPLPVIGFRLVYRATRKWALIFTADLLAVDILDYSGTLQDVYLVTEYRLSKVVGIGGGLNSLGFDLKVDDDDALAELRHNYRGILAFLAFHF